MDGCYKRVILLLESVNGLPWSTVREKITRRYTLWPYQPTYGSRPAAADRGRSESDFSILAQWVLFFTDISQRKIVLRKLRAAKQLSENAYYNFPTACFD